jgi:hypothetical protein
MGAVYLELELPVEADIAIWANATALLMGPTQTAGRVSVSPILSSACRLIAAALHAAYHPDLPPGSRGRAKRPPRHRRAVASGRANLATRSKKVEVSKIL